jgi:glycosyltransferase involved in cell wall biosynthesis
MKLNSLILDVIKRSIAKLSFDGQARLAKRVRAVKKRRRKLNTYTDSPKLSLIVLSFNHKANVRRILDRLRLTSADELIVCEDGSIDGSDRLWLRHLTRPNDFLIRSNDIHEIRAYNRAVHLARGEFVCVLQDDDIPPPDNSWVQQALALFDRHPKLAILGAYQGWFLDFNGPTRSVARKVIGEWMTEIGNFPFVPELPFKDPVLGIPFMFVEGVSIGPIFYRRDAFLALGGFDLHFSRPGEPGILSDHDICLKAWLSARHVGLFGPVPFQRRVGKQGTIMFGNSERVKNFWDNLTRIKRTYRNDFETIEGTLNELNQSLIPSPP